MKANKELGVKLHFYLTMLEGETKEEAIARAEKLFCELEKKTNSSCTIHEYEEIEY